MDEPDREPPHAGERLTREDVLRLIEKHGGPEGLDLRWANLREADLGALDLHGTNLSGDDLQGARLSGAKLQGANLQGAYLSGQVGGSASWRTACPQLSLKAPER